MAESIRGDKSVCLPVEIETQYRDILFNPKAFRQYVIQIQSIGNKLSMKASCQGVLRSKLEEEMV